MTHITVDFARSVGKVKPMHAVNNGPVYKFSADQRITNLDAFREAGIPYARNHDAAFYATYGGEHIVDVANIFPDFERDVNDPASYDFALTDEYLRIIELGGMKVFYRLGNKIEHWSKKYGTLPPADFHKWAQIAEHIIRHYTEGWADGFHMDIEYWEIWNEPDLDPDDSTHKRCWGGTKKEFFEFYKIVAVHLKTCFPHLKIGGPALAHDWNWAEEFLREMEREHIPLDFFSWHRYASNPMAMVEKAHLTRDMLDRHGYRATETNLNEWNYVRGWNGEDWIYSLRAEKGLKGASFTTAVMCACQYAPVDMLMYYDARPCGMNGLFSTDYVNEKLKGYYPFLMFHHLYRLHSAFAVETEGNAYAAAASDGERAAVLVTHFHDCDDTPTEWVSVHVRGFAPEGGVRAQFYILDQENDLNLWREEIFTGTEYAPVLKLPLYASVLILLDRVAD